VSQAHRQHSKQQAHEQDPKEQAQEQHPEDELVAVGADCAKGKICMRVHGLVERAIYRFGYSLDSGPETVVLVQNATVYTECVPALHLEHTARLLSMTGVVCCSVLQCVAVCCTSS